MRLSYLANAIGLILIYVGVVILLPIIVALIYRDFTSIHPFIQASIISVTIGLSLRYLVKDANNAETLNDINKSEALLTVALSWIMFALISAIPYLSFGLPPINALFEAVSGITTTGATILTNFDYPKAFFFWRALTQWLGGLGIIVLFIAVLPQFAVAGRQMFSAEVPGPVEDKFTPRIRNTASALWKVYIGLTICAIVLFSLAGMPIFDSVCNSLSTLSAGGFSPNPNSIMGYNSRLITWICIIFMFFSGASFSLQYKAIVKRNIKLIFNSEEFRCYAGMFLFLSALICISLLHNNHSVYSSVTDSIYQVISIATTTGSVSVDYTKWEYTPKILLYVVMFMGACSSSAGGGIKFNRWILIFKYMKNSVTKILHPNAVINIKLDGMIVPSEVISQIIMFVLAYFILFGLSAIIITILEHNLTIGLSSAIASVGNVGPAMGHVIGPMGSYDSLRISTKLILIANMIVGRLELIPFLVLLQKDFWTLRK